MGSVSKSSGDNKLRELKRKTIVAVVATCISLALIVGVVIWLLSSGDLLDRVRYGNVQIESAEQAMQMIDDGDVDRVIYYYENQIDSTNNNIDKAAELANLASLLSQVSDDGTYNEQNLRRALKYAVEAENVAPSIQTSALLYEIYLHLGDQSNTDKYERITSGRIEESGTAELSHDIQGDD